MKHAAPLFALTMLTAISVAHRPALAADPVFPPGVRVGLAPLVGLAPAKTFVGFETSDQGVKVLMTELPAAAFNEVETAFKANPAGMAAKPESIETTAGKAFYTIENAKDATGNVRRYSMIVGGGTFSGYVAVQVPENAQKIYTDDAVRQMLASAVVRKEVPLAEQLGLMPFKVAEMSDFKTVRTLAPGAALLLADSTDENSIETSPFMVIGSLASAPEKAEDRGRFAQQAAGTIPGLREGRITMSEPQRIDGMPGYETRIDAVSGKNNTPVSVVQWLRFGGGKITMRIIASAPRDDWAKAFPRFRAVRDGIEPR
ncbi:hypothetical protein [Tardiphaga sp. 709]|uniref:hypothetical protein n=1 Tax=unclassified Tardiphaga TaxID=2631404 RepID=UPI0028E86988|nr:hypothetical protein [Tardiphaga sp. 709]WNV07414.1 hypothetical protein RSO67_17935 [Tardiphaga sp. 709]